MTTGKRKYDTGRVRSYYDLARDHALRVVEQMARDILIAHPNLGEFVMAMGVASFTDQIGESVHPEERSYMRHLSEFLDEWDETFGLTGTSMRFTATGDKRTDW